MISLIDKTNSVGRFGRLFNLRFHVSCGGSPLRSILSVNVDCMKKRMKDRTSQCMIGSR